MELIWWERIFCTKISIKRKPPRIDTKIQNELEFYTERILEIVIKNIVSYDIWKNLDATWLIHLESR